MAFDFSYPNAPANERGWGPGWPNCQTGKMVPLVVRGVGFPGGVREEVHDLLVLLIEESLDRGWIPRLDDPGCWGFGCRDTKRSDGTHTGVASNHSWGLAVDINAPHNVFGANTHQIPKAMADFWRKYGWRWLGPPIGDWMHFDFAGTPSDARAMTEKARRDLVLEAPMTDAEKQAFDALRARVSELDAQVDKLRMFRNGALWMDENWSPDNANPDLPPDKSDEWRDGARVVKRAFNRPVAPVT